MKTIVRACVLVIVPESLLSVQFGLLAQSPSTDHSCRGNPGEAVPEEKIAARVV
jgi:hypothetical protein